VCRLDLDDLAEGKPVDLPGTGLTFTLKKRGHVLELLGDGPDEATLKTMPLYPSVQFELSGAAGRGTYLACARLPHLAAFRDGEPVEQVAAWYHYPDFRWGQSQRLGALQFLHVPGDRLYYRVFGKEGLKGPGKILDTDAGEVHELPWKPLDMKFQVMAWLPQAARREWVRPRQVRPGAEPAERLDPALRLTLESNGEKQEVWVRLSHQATQVTVGKEMFFVRYRAAARPLDFSLTLKRARQVSDPGTDRPASFESDVVLAHEQDGSPETSEHRIYMNHTLDHGGYKVYQTNYRPLTDPQTGAPLVDADGRLVSLSGFTLADDPGLYFKYAGSCLLVLGIATMFYMRAYFFKPRPASG
jgi:hypothetical protein